MGPCATCGTPTEPEADFCPACAGYAAPATVYAYSPTRLSYSDGELEQILAPLGPPPAAAQNERLTGPAGEPWAPEDMQADPAARPWAGEHVASRRVSAGVPNEGRWIVATTTLIVLIIAAGTVLLLGHAHPASAPRASPARSTSPAAAASPVVPTAPGPQVAVAQSAASFPQEAAVVSFLARYFEAINEHDFTAYEQLFDPPLRADLSAPTFDAGYGTTTDSAIALTDIGVIGSGEVVAHVTFISHQQPSASPTASACTAWNISLYLLKQGGSAVQQGAGANAGQLADGYLLQQPPAGYQASYATCS